MNYSQKSDIAHKSLWTYFGADSAQQYLNNYYPTDKLEDNEVFNYWWLAHYIDTCVDGYLRTKNQDYLNQAIETYKYSKKRNKGTLIHEYYDDMLWNALAILRVYEITHEQEHLKEAIDIWDDLVNTGWNDIMDGGFAWKKTQMYYKNTPVNCPFIILSARLYGICREIKYMQWALKTYEWQKNTLVNKETGFVYDGINRENDGRIDIDWKFTYNQGIYIGANLEIYRHTRDPFYIEEAKRTALIALKELTKNGIFIVEGEGGDEGLFRGIFARYLKMLIEYTYERDYIECLKLNADKLWENCYNGENILVSRDWSRKAEGKIPFSVQLSGIMIFEMMASLLE